jgi:hypothetical protein
MADRCDRSKSDADPPRENRESAASSDDPVIRRPRHPERRPRHPERSEGSRFAGDVPLKLSATRGPSLALFRLLGGDVGTVLHSTSSFMHPVEKYLHKLQQDHSTGAGVPEASHYSALSDLLDAVGSKLKPKVRCIAQLKNKGAGSPDFGLYTSTQFQTSKDYEPLTGQLPERGVVEVKPVKDDSWLTAASKQVSKYWDRYGQVLVTNYRDFVLVGKDETGKSANLETFRIADNEAAFWEQCIHPQKTAKEMGERLLDYLERVMRSTAQLNSPEDVAWFLASYAREARGRIEAVANLPGLQQLRTGLEQSLGMEFSGKDGEHFFRSTLVQTLFYGVFSSWVIWDRESSRDSGANFNWREAAWNLHVPMIAALFTQIATPQQLKPLGLDDVLDWTGSVLNRVDRDAFFKKFEQEHAIQYFYEPFLKAFDPVLRKDLGVWYTPREIVRYQVARVDKVLRDELKIADGLADSSVYVLDPCCGTGAYLIETLRTIHETLQAKGGGALVGQKLKKAAMERVFGFELLPAPFVVSHLQLGLLLAGNGAPLNESERAAVYLTNSLTGWEPPQGPKKQIPIPEMEQERDAADRVKQDKPILVIMGNPPYNAFAGVNPMEKGADESLVAAYKEGLISQWQIKKFNLDDLYVRFFRLAEKRILKTTRGVVSFISNYSWTSEPSFVVLRDHLLTNFDKLWIENMHGNRKISEYAPDGGTSETVFAMRGSSAGIQQGVVISLWVKRGLPAVEPATILYRDDIDAAKATARREQLLGTLNEPDFEGRYSQALPTVDNRYSFRPMRVAADYLRWPRVTELCAEPPSNGLMEKRGGALVDTDRAALAARMQSYFNPEIEWDEYKALGYGLTKAQARFDPKKSRVKIRDAEKYSDERLRRYAVRPFENSWCYYSPIRPLWNEPRPSLWAQCWEGNNFFVSRLRTATDREGIPSYFVTGLSDDHLIVPDASCFPTRLRKKETTSRKDHKTQHFAFNSADSTIANLSATARTFLEVTGASDLDQDPDSAATLWMHALAITYSAAYLAENADGVRQDWPHIPLPNDLKRLLASSALGRNLATLLDPEQQVAGVTAGTLRSEMRAMGILESTDSAAVNLGIAAGWGHAGKDGVTMPGPGLSKERQYSPKEREAIETGAAEIDLTPESAFARLGRRTCDVYLNGSAYWKNVPLEVWEYRIGGYQVLKKWLSYREEKLLGRRLSLDEAEYVTDVVRRIAAILLLGPALDANYAAVKASSYAWPGKSQI